MRINSLTNRYTHRRRRRMSRGKNLICIVYFVTIHFYAPNVIDDNNITIYLTSVGGVTVPHACVHNRNHKRTPTKRGTSFPSRFKTTRRTRYHLRRHRILPLACHFLDFTANFYFTDVRLFIILFFFHVYILYLFIRFETSKHTQVDP